ncbi:MAG: hypothetical protein H0U76_12765, partial [Ktedonobacteraceae bacterium]|nr:hypothetical protein [Ktedonobacteraceae bacterium]
IVSSSGGINLNNSPALGNETILSDTGATIVSSSGGINLNNSPALGNETILSNTDSKITSSSEARRQTGTVSSDPVALTSSYEVAPSPSVALPVAPIPRPTALIRQHKRWLILISSFLLIVLIGTSILWAKNRDMPAAISPTSVGTITFLNSGQLDAQNIPLINDVLQIHLSHIPVPSPGQRYYAWAQNYPGTHDMLFLGALQDQQDNAVLSYTDSLHRDLLAQMSNFLVTEQPLNSIPTRPSLEKTQWRYSAMLPQTLSSSDHLSYLDHLRHLLVAEPILERLQLHHGITFWLLHNTQELYANLLRMQDTSNPQELRQILINLLSYLDGPCAHNELSSIPGKAPSASASITQNTIVSLLDCTQETKIPGYLTSATQELNAMMHAPDVSTQQMQHASQMKDNLATLQGWFQQMHKDVLQLVQMDNAHLKQAQVERNALENLGSDVIGGHFDPLTQTLHPGMKVINDEMTLLARLDIFPYKSL